MLRVVRCLAVGDQTCCHCGRGDLPESSVGWVGTDEHGGIVQQDLAEDGGHDPDAIRSRSGSDAKASVRKWLVPLVPGPSPIITGRLRSPWLRLFQSFFNFPVTLSPQRRIPRWGRGTKQRGGDDPGHRSRVRHALRPSRRWVIRVRMAMRGIRLPRNPLNLR